MINSPEVIWINKVGFFEQARKSLQNVDVVLDVGAGIRPQGFVSARVHICIEPHLPYALKLVEMAKSRSELVPFNTTWEEGLKLLPDSSVDTVFALDFIEHIEKEEGKLFIAEAIRVARRQVVLFTPFGFYSQEYLEPLEKDRWGLDGTQWQVHKSGWVPDDFTKEWVLSCCKEFHDKDQYGDNLSTPIGAIWAVYNITDTTHGKCLFRNIVYFHIDRGLRKILSWFRKKY